MSARSLVTLALCALALLVLIPGPGARAASKTVTVDALSSSWLDTEVVLERAQPGLYLHLRSQPVPGSSAASTRITLPVSAGYDPAAWLP